MEQSTNYELQYWESMFVYNITKCMEALCEKRPEMNEEMNEKARKIVQGIKKLVTVAPEYDYGNVHQNGIRSMIKLWAIYLKKGYKKGSVDDMMNIINILSMCNRAHEIIVTHLVNNRDNYVIIEQRKISQEMFVLFSDGKLCQTLHSQPFTFAHLPAVQKILLLNNLKFTPLVIPGVKFTDRFKSMASTKGGARVMNELLTRMTVQELKSSLWKLEILHNILVRPVIKIFRILTFNATSCKSVKSIVRSSYSLDIDINGITYRKREQDNTVRYQLVQYKPRDKTLPYYGKVLIFLHGGCFVGPRADLLENVCIRTWAEFFPGLAVVNFDYSLGPEHRFPTQIQELLDFYLWLTNPVMADDVMKTFGFIPTDIVISGQSGGASCVVGSLIAMNELNRRFQEKFKFPKGIIMENGKINMSYHLSPSYLLAAVDPIATPHLLPLALQSYVVMTKFDEGSSSKRMLTALEQSALPHKALYDEEYDIVTDVLLTPTSYDKYDGIIGTSLHIYSHEYDPISDDCLILAKKWNGKVSITINDRLAHIGHLFKIIDPVARKANKRLIEMIKNSFE